MFSLTLIVGLGLFAGATLLSKAEEPKPGGLAPFGEKNSARVLETPRPSPRLEDLGRAPLK